MEENSPLCDQRGILLICSWIEESRHIMFDKAGFRKTIGSLFLASERKINEFYLRHTEQRMPTSWVRF